MTLDEAIKKAEEGCFVTNDLFDTYQCLHFYNGKLYYEDGAVVTEKFLRETAYLRNAIWRVKFNADQVNKEKLADMHKKAQGLMLINKSYVDAVTLEVK